MRVSIDVVFTAGLSRLAAAAIGLQSSATDNLILFYCPVERSCCIAMMKFQPSLVTPERVTDS